MTEPVIAIDVPHDGWRSDIPPVERLMDTTWSFAVRDGEVYAPFLRLRPGGRIGGYRHAHETAWARQGECLVFYDERGSPSTVFDRQVRSAGRMVLHGTYCGVNRTPHALTEVAAAHEGERPFLPAQLARRPTGKRRRNLVVLRANEASLHPSWAVDIAEQDRSWDLCTSFYGEASAFPVADFAEYTALQREERKFQAIRSLLLSHPELLDYEYFMFPDDDLQMSWSDINASFHAMRFWRLELAQPSLHPDGVINYDATRQDRAFRVRFTSMIEVMIPLMSRAALRACLPTFDLSRSAFGIDYAWAKIVGDDPRAIGIIDDVAVLHTRPTGSNYDMQAAYKEGDALSARYGKHGWFQVNVLGGVFRGGS